MSEEQLRVRAESFAETRAGWTDGVKAFDSRFPTINDFVEEFGLDALWPSVEESCKHEFQINHIYNDVVYRTDCGDCGARICGPMSIGDFSEQQKLNP